MKALTVLLSFVFVVQVFGQGYIGRTRAKKPVAPVMPIHPKPVRPVLPVHPKPVVSPLSGMGMPGGLAGGLASLGGGGRLPIHIRQLLGSTINGQAMIGGTGQLPRHGGAGIGESFSNGMRNGWGGDAGIAQVPAVSSWVDPLQGHDFPMDYAGGELMFDNDAGRFVAARQQHNMAKATGVAPVVNQVGHNIAKAEIQHDVAKASGMAPFADPLIGGPMTGPLVDPVGHNVAKATGIAGSPMQMQHDIGKATSGMSLGPIAGPFGVDPVEHSMAKSTGMMGGPMQMEHDIGKASSGMAIGPAFGGQFGNQMPFDTLIGDPFLPAVDPVRHNVAKSTGMAAATGRQVQHNIAKSSMGLPSMGPVVDPVGHAMDKASAGVGGMMVGPMDPFGQEYDGPLGGVDPVRHNFAKSTGMGAGPMQAQHNIVKASVGIPPMNPVVNPVQHNMVKASSGMVGGGSMIDPIGHNIAKASSGVHMMDPLGGSMAAGKPMFRNPVHNVNKAAASGIPAMGHDDLAARVGTGIAMQTIQETSQIIDMGSNGGVSMGNPLAGAAAHGLAKEAVHVAGKTLGMASTGVVPQAPISSGTIKRITGYQGRRRKTRKNPLPPPSMKQW